MENLKLLLVLLLLSSTTVFAAFEVKYNLQQCEVNEISYRDSKIVMSDVKYLLADFGEIDTIHEMNNDLIFNLELKNEVITISPQSSENGLSFIFSYQKNGYKYYKALDEGKLNKVITLKVKGKYGSVINSVSTPNFS